MGSTVDTIDGMLKKLYDSEGIQRLENKEAPTWESLPVAKTKPAGQGFELAVNVKGNQRGTSAINELEALPTAGVQTVVNGTILPKVITHKIEFSGLSLEISGGGDESFTDNYVYQTDEGLRDTFKYLNAQLFRDGSGKFRS